MSPENVRAHVQAELARGEEALRAAHELLRLGLLNDAVSRAYYAAMHLARALLLTEGVDPSTHGGVGAMLIVVADRFCDAARALLREGGWIGAG